MKADHCICSLPRCPIDPGPVGLYLDGFAHSLGEAGYLPISICNFLSAAGHLGRWMEQTNRTVESLDENAISSFREHLQSCQCNRRVRGKCKCTLSGVRHFLAYLRGTGIAPVPESPPTEIPPALLTGFCEWMRHHRGVTESTIFTYRPIIVDLLATVKPAPAAFSAANLRRFVIDRASGYSASMAKTIAKATRLFLRYLAATGQGPVGLDAAIPSFPSWRLAALPPVLSADQLEQVIAACDSRTSVGVRDRAMILLMARLGLRASDVIRLRLSDIDWPQATIRLSGKSRRETRLPLPQEVGDAILAYLDRGRPSLLDDHVFVRTRAPHGPMRTSGAASAVVVAAMQRAGVVAPIRGAHLLRHSCATRLLDQGLSLHAIAQVLHHASIETTAHYAKVDRALLQLVAQLWPEELPC